MTPPPPRRHGAWPTGTGTVRFTLWAPLADVVQITRDDIRIDMTTVGDGWWTHEGPGGHGTRYAYALDGADPLPDPAARWLPDGVHQRAAVVDPSTWAWTDQHFQAPPITAAVIYELHIGTFTTDGTFAAAISHLQSLVELGITHVEVMPVNAFDGHHGWGYDGVAWWAVHQPYGGPDEFSAFVDACHAHGLAVILDVVHNHLGPSGNHLPSFGPYLQSDAESTWGRVINLDGPDSDPVRTFIIDNVLAWLRDHHVDALRLDAVHALDDRGSATHLLAQISDAVADLAESSGRHLELIAETDRNDPLTITPRARNGLGMDAQWADDLHHAIHVAVTGETDGYYVDYADPVAALGRAYTQGFVYDGNWWSPFRRRVVGGPLPAELSSRRLIACIQNHDQVGNRAAGDRLTTLVPPDLVRVAIALLCLAPQTPMLFMGEEYGETNPFQFFTDMPGEDLRQGIRDGRRREFEGFEAWQGEVPDPLDPATFARSILDRRREPTDDGRARRALWSDLLALRRSEPALATGRRDLVHAHSPRPDVLVIDRLAPDPADSRADRGLSITVNLGDIPLAAADLPPNRIDHSLVLTTGATRYGGNAPHDDHTVPPCTLLLRRIPTNSATARPA